MPQVQDDSKEDKRESFFAKLQLIGSAKIAFQQFSAVMKSTMLYPEEHPSLHLSAEKLLSTLDSLLKGRKEAAFYLVGGELFFETLSVPVDQSLALLMEQFISRDVSGIIFKQGLTERELIKFAVMINRDPSYFISRGGITGALETEDVTHIELHRVMIVDRTVGGAIKEGKKQTAKIFMDAVDIVKEMVQDVHMDKAINMRRINATVQIMVDNVLDNRDALLGLTNIKMYDEYTFAHSVNTAVLAISLGSFLSFGKSQIAALGVAGLLHDIGKVNIPYEIINKPDKLTDEEWEIVKRHPIEGALILSSIPGVTKLAMVAAFEHHQHGDVQGYPWIDDRLQQHPYSHIISLADAYDALTAARVYYKVQISPEEAIRIMVKKRGTTFDATLVKAFVNMMGIFPTGTLLKLDSGEIGLVMHQTRDLMRPRILILTKFDGSENKIDAEVSLLETIGGKYKRSIVGIIDNQIAKIDVKSYLA
ncbi:MAG TPA: HD-GYP domain-containing protein [Nitrospirota bacterium]|nr:HD-GYP domain-containing protein [Nitrospirota bacterium]